MHSFLLLALLFSMPLISAQSSALSLNPSQRSAYQSVQASLFRSIRTDPGWSSVDSIMSAATGKEGAAASSLASLNLPSQPAHTAPVTVLISNLISELPTQVQSYYYSLLSVEKSILNRITATSTGSSVATASETLSSVTAAGTSASPTPNAGDRSVGGITGSPLVVYAAFVGVVGAAAVLL